jgi:TP901 family phage tail tape measure protein
MANTFNIVANLQLQASNLGPVVQDIRNQLKGVSLDVKLNVDPAAQRGLDSLNNKIGTLLGNLKAVQSAAQATSASFAQFGAVGTSLSQTESAATKAVASVRAVGTELRAAGSFAEQFGAQIALATRRFLAFQVGATALFGFVRGIKQGVSEALQFQQQMIRLAQVGGDTAGVLRGVEDSITRISKSTGTSSLELAKVAVTLRQAGISAAETSKHLETLAEAALSPNFGSMAQTVEGLIAVQRQFNLSAEQTKEAMGGINAVAGAFATEASDLITAVQKAGGAFKSAGGNVNEFLGLFTAVRATTRESADTIASGLRTIFSRLQRGDVIENLKALQINLRYTHAEAQRLGDVRLENQFVGAYEAIKRVSSALAELRPTDPRYAAALEQIGGSRQISKTLPLVQQFAEAQRAANTAQAGSVSLTASAVKAQDSLLNKTSQVKEEFLAFFRTLAESKSFQTFARGLLDIASGLGSVLSVLKPVIPLLLTLGTVKLAQSLTAGLPAFGAQFTAPLGRNVTASPSPIKRATGGIVPGVGDTDSVPAMLMPGEFVVRKQAAQRLGYDTLSSLNAGGPARLAGGGFPAVNGLPINDYVAARGYRLKRPIRFLPKFPRDVDFSDQQDYILSEHAPIGDARDYESSYARRIPSSSSSRQYPLLAELAKSDRQYQRLVRYAEQSEALEGPPHELAGPQYFRNQKTRIILSDLARVRAKVSPDLASLISDDPTILNNVGLLKLRENNPSSLYLLRKFTENGLWGGGYAHFADGGLLRRLPSGQHLSLESLLAQIGELRSPPEHVAHARRLARLGLSGEAAQYVPAGSSLLGFGSVGLALRTPDDDVIRVQSRLARKLAQRRQPYLDHRVFGTGRPPLEGVLQATDSLRLPGGVSLERLPYAPDISSLSKVEQAQHIESLQRRLYAQGYYLADVKAGNVGLYRGEPVAIDPGSVLPATANMLSPTKRLASGGTVLGINELANFQSLYLTGRPLKLSSPVRFIGGNFRAPHRVPQNKHLQDFLFTASELGPDVTFNDFGDNLSLFFKTLGVPHTRKNRALLENALRNFTSSDLPSPSAEVQKAILGEVPISDPKNPYVLQRKKNIVLKSIFGAGILPARNQNIPFYDEQTRQEFENLPPELLARLERHGIRNLFGLSDSDNATISHSAADYVSVLFGQRDPQTGQYEHSALLSYSGANGFRLHLKSENLESIPKRNVLRALLYGGLGGTTKTGTSIDYYNGVITVNTRQQGAVYTPEQLAKSALHPTRSLYPVDHPEAFRYPGPNALDKFPNYEDYLAAYPFINAKHRNYFDLHTALRGTPDKYHQEFLTKLGTALHSGRNLAFLPHTAVGSFLLEQYADQAVSERFAQRIAFERYGPRHYAEGGVIYGGAMPPVLGDFGKKELDELYRSLYERHGLNFGNVVGGVHVANPAVYQAGAREVGLPPFSYGYFSPRGRRVLAQERYFEPAGFKNTLVHESVHAADFANGRYSSRDGGFGSYIRLLRKSYLGPRGYLDNEYFNDPAEIVARGLSQHLQPGDPSDLFHPEDVRRYVGGRALSRATEGALSELVALTRRRVRFGSNATLDEVFGKALRPARFAVGGEASDTVPALLTPGEFVLNREAASRIGAANLHRLNTTGDDSHLVRGYAKGGFVRRADGSPEPERAARFERINDYLKSPEYEAVKRQLLGILGANRSPEAAEQALQNLLVRTFRKFDPAKIQGAASEQEAYFAYLRASASRDRKGGKAGSAGQRKASNLTEEQGEELAARTGGFAQVEAKLQELTREQFREAFSRLERNDQTALYRKYGLEGKRRNATRLYKTIQETLAAKGEVVAPPVAPTPPLTPPTPPPPPPVVPQPPSEELFRRLAAQTFRPFGPSQRFIADATTDPGVIPIIGGGLRQATVPRGRPRTLGNLNDPYILYRLGRAGKRPIRTYQLPPEVVPPVPQGDADATTDPGGIPIIGGGLRQAGTGAAGPITSDADVNTQALGLGPAVIEVPVAPKTPPVDPSVLLHSLSIGGSSAFRTLLRNSGDISKLGDASFKGIANQQLESLARDLGVENNPSLIVAAIQKRLAATSPPSAAPVAPPVVPKTPPPEEVHTVVRPTPPPAVPTPPPTTPGGPAKPPPPPPPAPPAATPPPPPPPGPDIYGLAPEDPSAQTTVPARRGRTRRRPRGELAGPPRNYAGIPLNARADYSDLSTEEYYRQAGIPTGPTPGLKDTILGLPGRAIGGLSRGIRGANAAYNNSSLGRFTNSFQGLGYPLLFAAPLLAENVINPLAGTAEAAATTGHTGGFRVARAAGGAFQGAVLGGVVGNSLLPGLGGAVGTLVGALGGLAGSLREAEKEIRDVHIENALKGLSNKIDLIVSGSAGATPGTLAGASANLSEALAKRDEENREKATHYFSFRPGFNAEEYLALNKKSYQDLTPQLPQLQAVLNRQVEDLLKGNPNLTGQQVVGQIQGPNKVLIDTIARIREISPEAVLKDVAKAAESRGRDIRVERQSNQANAQLESSVAAFGRLLLSVQAAADSLQNLRANAEILSETFEGRYSTTKFTANVDNLQQLGRPDRGALTPLGIIRADGGEQGERLFQAGQTADSLLRVLRPILVQQGEVAQRGGLGPNTGEDFNTAVGNALRRSLGDSRDAQAAVAVVQAQINHETGNGKNPERLFEQLRVDPEALTNRLANPFVEPIKQAATGAAKQLEDNFNRLVAGLRHAREQIDRINQERARGLELRAQSAKITAEFQADREGRPRQALDLVPLKTLEAPFREGQELLSGVRGPRALDPTFLGGELARVRGQLPGARDAAQKALEQFGSKDPRTVALAQSFVNLDSRAVNLQRALQRLTDTTAATSAAQEKLSKIEENRQGRLSFGESYLTSDDEGRFKIDQGLDLARAAAKQGSLDNFTGEEQGLILRALRTAGNSKLSGFEGTPVANDLADTLIRKTGGGTFDVGKDEQTQRQELQAKIAEAFQNAEKAQQELVKNLGSLNQGFIQQLTAAHQQFFQNLAEYFKQDKKTDLEIRRDTAQVEVDRLGGLRGQARTLARFGITDDNQLEALRRNPELFQNLLEKRRGIEDLGRLRQTKPGEIAQALANVQTDGTFWGRGSQLAFLLNNFDMRGAHSALAKQLSAPGIDLSGEQINQVRSRFRELAANQGLGAFTSIRKADEHIDVLQAALQQAIQEALEQKQAELINNAAKVQIDLEKKVQGGNFGGNAAQLEQLQKALASFGPGQSLQKLNTEFDAASAQVRAFADALVRLEKAFPAAPAQPQAPVPPRGFATGGLASGTDTVPAMLTPGEFVVNRDAAQANMGLLQTLNASRGPVGLAQGGIVQYLAEGGEAQDDPLARIFAQSQPGGINAQQKLERGILAAIRARQARQRRFDENREERDRALANDRPPQLEDFLPARPDGRQPTQDELDGALDALNNAKQAQVAARNRLAARELQDDQIRKAGGRDRVESAQADYLTGEFTYAAHKSNQLDSLILQQNLVNSVGRYRADAGHQESLFARQIGQRAQVEATYFAKHDKYYRKYLAGQAQVRLPINRAGGGPVPGPFGAGDVVPAMLSPGEYVLNANAVQNIGVGNVERANRYAGGGLVGGAQGGGAGLSPEIAQAFSAFAGGANQLSAALSSFAEAANHLDGSFAQFAISSKELATALQHFPAQLTVSGTQRVEVVITGAEALNGARGEMEKLIEAKVKEQLANEFKTKLPQAGLHLD